MLGKLLYGRFSFKETFWKFGVLASLIAIVVIKILKFFLVRQLGNLSISAYYIHHFSLININGTLLALTILYFLSLFIICCYSIILWLGLWRSSAEYNKSPFLRHMARLLILIIIYLTLKAGF